MYIDPSRMQQSAAEAGELLKALSNPHRLMLLCQLVGGEKSVGELASSLSIRDSAASQNLALMRKAGLVKARRDGHIVWYSIGNSDVRSILDALYKIYCASQPLCTPAEKKNSGKGKKR